MPLDQEISQAKAEAQAALYKAIAESVKELRQNASAAAEAEGLKHLAEAYAWLTYPSQPHG